MAKGFGGMAGMGGMNMTAFFYGYSSLDECENKMK